MQRCTLNSICYLGYFFHLNYPLTIVKSLQKKEQWPTIWPCYTIHQIMVAQLCNLSALSLQSQWSLKRIKWTGSSLYNTLGWRIPKGGYSEWSNFSIKQHASYFKTIPTLHNYIHWPYTQRKHFFPSSSPKIILYILVQMFPHNCTILVILLMR